MTPKPPEDGTGRQRRDTDHEGSGEARRASDRDRAERNRESGATLRDFSPDGYDEMLRMLKDGRIAEREAKRYFGCQYENAVRATVALHQRE